MQDQEIPLDLGLPPAHSTFLSFFKGKTQSTHPAWEPGGSLRVPVHVTSGKKGEKEDRILIFSGVDDLGFARVERHANYFNRGRIAKYDFTAPVYYALILTVSARGALEPRSERDYAFQQHSRNWLYIAGYNKSSLYT